MEEIKDIGAKIAENHEEAVLSSMKAKVEKDIKDSEFDLKFNQKFLEFDLKQKQERLSFIESLSKNEN